MTTMMIVLVLVPQTITMVRTTFCYFKLYFSINNININTNIVSIFNNEDNDVKLYNIFLPEEKTYVPSFKTKNSKNGKRKKKSTKKVLQYFFNAPDDSVQNKQLAVTLYIEDMKACLENFQGKNIS